MCKEVNIRPYGKPGDDCAGYVDVYGETLEALEAWARDKQGALNEVLRFVEFCHSRQYLPTRVRACTHLVEPEFPLHIVDAIEAEFGESGVVIVSEFEEADEDDDVQNAKGETGGLSGRV